jgi:hypothetical protein
MSPEDSTVFEELRERAFKAGAICVEFMTSYYGIRRELRFGVRLESDRWSHSFYGKTTAEVFRNVGIYLDERGA